MTRLANINDLVRKAAALAALALLAVAGGAEAAAAGVHGRVFALDENGRFDGIVPGARIEIKNQAGQPAAELTTTAAGYYQADLPAGQYFYKITAAGFRDEDSGRGFMLQLSEGQAVYNFSLTRGPNDPDRKPPETPVHKIGQLTGRVLEKTPDGKLVGIPAARIALRPSDGDRLLTHVTTGGQSGSARATGRYAISLAEGSWRASVSAEGFEMFVDPNPILVPADGSASRDFILSRSADETSEDQGIRGRITLVGRPAKPGATPQIQVRIVPLLDQRAADAPMATDRSGRYERQLSAGRYRVMATAEGYRSAKSGPADVLAGRYTTVNLRLVAESPSAEPTPPERTPSLPLVLHATVYEVLSGGQGKRPLSGASLLVRKSGQALADAARESTGAGGKAEIPIAEAGIYTVLAQKPGYTPAGSSVNITPGGENTNNILLVRRQEQAATAPAVDVPSGTPVQPVAPAPSRVRPWPIQPIIPPVREPENVALNVRVMERVSARESRPISGALVVVNQGRRRVASDSADREGLSTFQLDPGSYLIGAIRAGYEPAQDAVVLASGKVMREIYLKRSAAATPSQIPTLPPQDVVATLAVQVFGAQARNELSLRAPAMQTLGGAQVKILQNGSLAASGQADQAGRFLARLRPGAYQLYVSHPSFRMHQEGVALSGSGASRRVVLEPLAVNTPNPGPLPLPGFQPSYRLPQQQTPGSNLRLPQLQPWQQLHRQPNPPAAGDAQSGTLPTTVIPGRLTIDPRVGQTSRFSALRLPSASQTPPETQEEMSEEEVQNRVRMHGRLSKSGLK
jgi:hypothetical protein